MDKPLTRNIKPGEPPLDLRGYEKAGGYRAARRAVLEMAPADVTNLAFGTPGSGQLFVTAGTSVYLLRVSADPTLWP